ncbi:MAG: adenosylcobinamide-GDP ribazoletransferase [Alphaproteobacteria bacterium]
MSDPLDTNPNGDRIQGQTAKPPGPLGRLGRDLVLAAVFLTRLPLPKVSPAPLAGVLWAFPLVGFAVGLGAGAVYGAAVLAGLASLPAAILGLCAALLLTGALHEDGLADAADGFGGGGTVERKLAIMKDSRIGTYGMAALALALALKAALLAQIAAPWTVAAALGASGALSRAFIVLMLRVVPSARPDGSGGTAGRPDLLIASLSTVMGLVLWAGAIAVAPIPILHGVMALVLAGLIALALSHLSIRQIGGQTGDVLGAGQVLTEIAILAAVAAAH